MACKKLRIFPITSFETDGYPVVGTPIKPIIPGTDEKELVVTSLGFAPEISEVSLEADDNREKDTVSIGYTLSAKVYGVSPEALSALGLAKKDKNGNLLFATGKNTTHVCIFAEGADQKGTAYQFWFYDCVAKPLSKEIKTQLKNQIADTITLEFTGNVLSTTDFGDVDHAQVYKGSTGYVTDEPTANSLYKGVTE